MFSNVLFRFASHLFLDINVVEATLFCFACAGKVHAEASVGDLTFIYFQFAAKMPIFSRKISGDHLAFLSAIACYC